MNSFWVRRQKERNAKGSLSALRHRVLDLGTQIVDEQGSSLVEIAISISLLLCLLFGVIEVSLGLYTYHYVSDAAREGSRYALVRGALCTGFADCGIDGTGVQNYVRGLGYPYIDAANMTVTTTWYSASWSNVGTPAQTTTWAACGTVPAGCNLPGNQVEVKVKYTFPLNIPWWKSTVVSMGSTSRMVISQ
ncbi:MAG: TadE/TadG family type IV pilus assembly protein [Terracidiphilus sp.]